MSSKTGESESLQAPPREQWSGQLGFLIAAIGSAIGLGNIWRFPGVAYTNGGGAFIVPYVIALLAAGLPILFLDYALGHRFRGSPPAVFRRLSTGLEWLGWLQVFICFVIMTYYAVVVAWSLRYMFFSVNIAWGDDAAGFFQHYIGMDRLGSEVAYSPSVVMGVALPLLFVWGFGLVVTALGVSGGVEKANKIFLPLLVIMFAGLVVRALLLRSRGGAQCPVHAQVVRPAGLPGVDGGLRADLLLPVRGLRHHAHLRLLPPATPLQPGGNRPRGGLRQLLLRAVRRDRRLRDLGSWRTRSTSGSAR